MTMKTEKIRVPMYIADLSPAGTQACIRRRAERAAEKAPARKHRRHILWLVVVAAMVLCMSVVYTAPSNDAQTMPVSTLVDYIAADTAAWDISEDEIDMVNTAVMGVARGESRLAMQAVAQCIRQTCSDTGLSVEEVLAYYAYPTWDGEPNQDCLDAVQAIVDGHDAIAATIYWSYNPNVQDGTWHEGRTLVCTIDNLKFFA